MAVSGTPRRRERRAAERERIRRRRGSGGGGGGGEGASGGGIRARPARLGAAYSGWWWYACARPERAPKTQRERKRKGNGKCFFSSLSFLPVPARLVSCGIGAGDADSHCADNPPFLCVANCNAKWQIVALRRSRPLVPCGCSWMGLSSSLMDRRK